MAYGLNSFGEVPYGMSSGGSLDKNVVNVPTAFITMTTEDPIVGVEYQYTTRKHNALERRSPCPE